MQEIAKKLKNWEVLVAKKLIEQDKRELTNCLCIKRGILRQRVNHWLKFRSYRTKSIPCQMRGNFYDPESGSSSGATHVLDRNSTILSPRTLPRCDSGLPRNTQNCTGIMGNVFARPTICSRRTIFHNLQQFKEFGIYLSGIESWYYRYSKEREWNEKRMVECVVSITSLRM